MRRAPRRAPPPRPSPVAHGAAAARKRSVPPLRDEDAKLAEDDVDRLDQLSRARRARSASGDAPTVEVPWLRRTEYIANVLDAGNKADTCVRPRAHRRLGGGAHAAGNVVLTHGPLRQTCVRGFPPPRPPPPPRRPKAAPTASTALPADEQVELIMATFDDVKEIPRHPSDRSLRAVDVRPLLPNYFTWESEYAPLHAHASRG